MAGATNRPLLSGFYRVMAVALRLSEEGGLFSQNEIGSPASAGHIAYGQVHHASRFSALHNHSFRSLQASCACPVFCYKAFRRADVWTCPLDDNVGSQVFGFQVHAAVSSV